MNKNRVVLITGAASGIGKVAAQAFMNERYTVIICDRDKNALHEFRLESPEIDAIYCDVSNENNVISLANDIQEKHSRLDCLISNVGITGPTKKIEKTTTSEWNETITNNITSHFFCAKYFLDSLRNGTNACMLLTASVAGRLGYPLRSSYAASKWATIGLAKTLAKEWAESKICVNAVLPGIVNGPRMDNLIIARSEVQKKPTADVREELKNRAAIGRMIEMQEIADIMVFLCSSKARAITGQAISVCGDVEQL